MSFDGAGTFNINSSGQPPVASTAITVAAHTALTADLATGLSTCITKDGQTTTTASIPFAAGITVSSITDSTGLAANVYTPTFTNTSNITASTPHSVGYVRIGNFVIFSFAANITATATSTAVLTFTLPIASTLVNIYDLTGTASMGGSGSGQLIYLGANKGTFSFLPPTTSDLLWSGVGFYKVL